MPVGFNKLTTQGVILVTLAGLLFTVTKFGSGLERWSFDLLYLFSSPRNVEEFVIVYLDEKSHQELNQPLDKIWDRGLFGMVSGGFLEGPGGHAGAVDGVGAPWAGDGPERGKWQPVVQPFGDSFWRSICGMFGQFRAFGAELFPARMV